MKDYKFSRTYSFHPECRFYGYIFVSKNIIGGGESILKKGTTIASPWTISCSLDDPLSDTCFESQIATQPTKERGWTLA